MLNPTFLISHSSCGIWPSAFFSCSRLANFFFSLLVLSEACFTCLLQWRLNNATVWFLLIALGGVSFMNCFGWRDFVLIYLFDYVWSSQTLFKLPLILFAPRALVSFQWSQEKAQVWTLVPQVWTLVPQVWALVPTHVNPDPISVNPKLSVIPEKARVWTLVP